ncbi:hypothetical protein [Desulfosporosinus sp. Sb-LF]|uniref:hypothetical protein n=1 Tax=Desulfosporosinus sp. Sb-LF TaxID=2560027 RepID=UPI00107EEA0F|nr:hypothetical protein [Desulfosporosinus sp. Sb-LF]TGE34504.1 hypothetical protein E4K68_02105 [Desulfosporosinus sp. Sb-LF]
MSRHKTTNCTSLNPTSRPTTQCGPLPGTILRIFIPPGAVINLLNLIEVASPSGVCLIIRLPFLGGGSGSGTMDAQSIINAVQAAGGTAEIAQ